MEASPPPTHPPAFFKSPSGRKFTQSPSGRHVTFVLEDDCGPGQASTSTCSAVPTSASTIPLKSALIKRPDEAPPAKVALYARFKTATKALKKEVLALYYAIHDPRTPLLAKVIPWMVLAYALSPIDLIPDFIPVLGLLDDLLMLPGMIWLAIRLIPRPVMAQARFRAEHEPMRLSRNWMVAVLIFLVWMAGIEYSAWFILNNWGSPEVCQYQWHILGGIASMGAISFVCWLVSAVRREGRKHDANKAEQGDDSAAQPTDVVSVDAEYETQGRKVGLGDTGLHEPLLVLISDDTKGS